MPDDKKLKQKTDELEITQESNNELDLEDLNNVSGGVDYIHVGATSSKRFSPRVINVLSDNTFESEN